MVLWLFVAPLCSLLAIALGYRQHDLLIVLTAIVAICVIPVGCLPVAALVGIRWPYHPLELKYRWEHRHPLPRMIVRWAILVVAPYGLVPALAILMTVPALVVIVRANEDNSHVVHFINAFGRQVGVHVHAGTRSPSAAMFIVCVAITRGLAILTWLVGRGMDLRLIRRRHVELVHWLSDPTMG